MSAAVELVAIPALIAGTGLASFAAGRMRHTSAGGRHPAFAVAGPSGGGSRPQAPAREPGPESPASARRRPRRGWRVTVTAVAAAAVWAALTVYGHMTGYCPLVIALIAAALTWSRIRPGKARRRAHGW